ncbi:hypothetical protein [Gemmata sp.]
MNGVLNGSAVDALLYVPPPRTIRALPAERQVKKEKQQAEDKSAADAS